MSTLRWVRDYDDNDSPYYEALSALHDEGSPFRWRIYQKGALWALGGDEELVSKDSIETYADPLFAAMEAQSLEDEMVKQAKEEWDALSPEEQQRLKEEAGY